MLRAQIRRAKVHSEWPAVGRDDSPNSRPFDTADERVKRVLARKMEIVMSGFSKGLHRVTPPLGKRKFPPPVSPLSTMIRMRGRSVDSTVHPELKPFAFVEMVHNYRVCTNDVAHARSSVIVDVGPENDGAECRSEEAGSEICCTRAACDRIGNAIRLENLSVTRKAYSAVWPRESSGVRATLRLSGRTVHIKFRVWRRESSCASMALNPICTMRFCRSSSIS